LKNGNPQKLDKSVEIVKEEKSALQSFKQELKKKIKSIERKEEQDGIIRKVAQYGSIYGK